MDYRGRNALITGASSGIGESFAKALAARGANLVLVARRQDKLEAIAASVRKEHGVRAEVVAADLSREGAAQESAGEAVRRLGRVDVLVNNAGFATVGRFDGAVFRRVHEQVMLNVTAVVDLAHAVLPGMVERGEGVIVNVASTSGFQPVAYMAVYGATKAFVLSFSEAIWAENRARGVRVLALCPGATDTEFFDVAGTAKIAVGKLEPPDLVVRRALDALDRGKGFLISGIGNYAMAQCVRITPRAVVASMSERVMRSKIP